MPEDYGMLGWVTVGNYGGGGEMDQMPRGCRLGECQLRGPAWRRALSLATSGQQVLLTVDAGEMGERSVLPPAVRQNPLDV